MEIGECYIDKQEFVTGLTLKVHLQSKSAQDLSAMYHDIVLRHAIPMASIFLSAFTDLIFDSTSDCFLQHGARDRELESPISLDRRRQYGFG